MTLNICYIWLRNVLSSMSGFNNIPHDIIMFISIQLSLSDIKKLALTCKHTRQIKNYGMLWKSLTLETFIINDMNIDNWLDQYIILSSKTYILKTTSKFSESSTLCSSYQEAFDKILSQAAVEGYLHKLNVKSLHHHLANNRIIQFGSIKIYLKIKTIGKLKIPSKPREITFFNNSADGNILRCPTGYNL